MDNLPPILSHPMTCYHYLQCDNNETSHDHFLQCSVLQLFKEDQLNKIRITMIQLQTPEDITKLITDGLK